MRRRRKGNSGDTLIWLSVIILGAFGFCAICAPLITNYGPNEQVLRDRLLPPAWSEGGDAAHLLGTDDLGRDLYTRVIYGTRTSFAIAILTVLIAGSIGVLLGLLSGYFPKVDTVVMRLADIQLSFPGMLLALAIVAVIGGGFTNLILVMAITTWVQFARVVRAEVLAIRRSDYVLAAQTLGVGNLRLLIRHVLPNIIAPVVTIATYQIASAITAEASFSYLGLGIDPTTPSWGNILRSGQLYMNTAWWISVFPGVCILLMVIAINLLGDALRDYLDPKSVATRKKDVEEIQPVRPQVEGDVADG